MYFLEFQSYKDAVEKAKGFHVECNTAHKQHVSSPVPPQSYASVMDSIVHFMESKTPWMQWDRESGSIVVVPYETVLSLRLVLR